MTVAAETTARILIVLAMLSLSPMQAAAQPLPSDHLIVPGERIGNAELGPADQGALVRNLGEPNETDQRGDRAIYRYGAAKPDGGSPDELLVTLDLSTDAPFEIATASPAYHTREGLGVGSTAAAIRAALGPPLCDAVNGADGIIVYDAIWFGTAQGVATRVSIRAHVSLDGFRTGAVQC